ncbi:hypothetical protein O181_067785 [Austropuccinia psidii MF-1]|uniref:Uncharacterized protein n=1 Tax=Austropuccinia psidii MF-1 TaxID=1389203 RepID=A0A9Q3I6G3_9BASI|nr:hypothetical protein [Austropuccinia psidii MF-1]
MYLWGSLDLGLLYSRTRKSGLTGYSDSNLGNCLHTRRLITGFLAFFIGFLVLWKTKKQPIVSLSTAEAECKSLCNLTSELMWLRQWCKEFLVYEPESPLLVYKDNKACINSANGNRNIIN